MVYSIVIELKKPNSDDIKRLVNFRFGMGCQTFRGENKVVYAFKTREERDEKDRFLHALLKANFDKFSGDVTSYFEPESSERLKKEADTKTTA